jgi:hypothetical protein
MLPAPPRKSMPAAAAAAAAAPPAARQQQIVVASDSDASSHSKNHANGHGKTGSNVVSGLRLRALERGESGVGAAAVVAQLRSALTANLGRVSDLFREWDVDSSGTVDKAEFHKALMRLGLNSTKAESAAIFDSLDEDASGALEFRELHKKLRCLPPSARAAAPPAHEDLPAPPAEAPPAEVPPAEAPPADDVAAEAAELAEAVDDAGTADADTAAAAEEQPAGASPPGPPPASLAPPAESPAPSLGDSPALRAPSLVPSTSCSTLLRPASSTPRGRSAGAPLSTTTSQRTCWTPRPPLLRPTASSAA